MSRNRQARASVNADLLLPTRDFYWTVIEGATDEDPNRPTVRVTLDEAFERDLPEPIEGLVVRYASLPHAVIGCALPPERARAALESGTLVLRPRSLPPPIRDLSGDRSPDVLRALNFLVDEFEPAPITAMRIARRRLLLAGAAASLAVCAGGFWLRSNGLERDAEQSTAQANATRMRALSAADQGTGPDDATLRLQRELQHLERARGEEAEKARLRDAADGLAAFLAVWPKHMETRVGSLQVAATQITLNVEVPDAAAAEALSTALQGVNGWSLQPPRTEIGVGHARMNATLHPKREPETTATTKVADKEDRS